MLPAPPPKPLLTQLFRHPTDLVDLDELAQRLQTCGRLRCALLLAGSDAAAASGPQRAVARSPSGEAFLLSVEDLGGPPLALAELTVSPAGHLRRRRLDEHLNGFHTKKETGPPGVLAAVHAAWHAPCRTFGKLWTIASDSWGNHNEFRMELRSSAQLIGAGPAPFSRGAPGSLGSCVAASDSCTNANYLLSSRQGLWTCSHGPLDPWEELPGGRLPDSLDSLTLHAHGGKLTCLVVSQGRATEQDRSQLRVLQLDAASDGSAWQAVPGGCLGLPASEHGFCAAASSYQGSKWMVVLRPWLQPSPRPRLDPVFNCGLGTRVPAAGAGQCQGGSARGPAAAVGDEALLCIYDMADSTWVQPQHVQVVASSSGSSLLREAAGEQGGGANPAVACSQYFAAQGQDAAGWGPAAAAAAAAARGALKDHSLEPHAGAAAVFRRQRQQAAALMVDAVDNLLAAWREWAQLPPPRFGEIAAPEPLPYDLRQAQALRAVSAEAQPGRIWLQLSADATLPPIPCPLSAVAQSGELQRLLEVAGEATAGCGSSSHGGLEAAGEPELLLPLAGVSAEEHAALGALVGCLAGCTHAGLLEATQLLDVARLADLLDAPALLAESLAVLACMAPGPETFAPLLALAEGRQYNEALQHLKRFYRHALVLHLLTGREPLLRWALHGLRSGVDTILEACTEVAATWLPHHDPDRYLGSLAGDLEVLASPEWQAAAQEQPGRVRPLLEALLALWGRQLEAARSSDGMGGSSSGAGSKRPRLGPFQSAVVQPKRDPAAVRTISDEELAQQARALLQRLQRALPRQAAQLRGQRTAAAFAEAEARARRQRRL